MAFNPSNGALRRLLTPQRLAELGLRPVELSNEELKSILTPERQRELGLRLPRPSDDEFDHIPIIEFFCEPNHFGVVPPPVPAAKKIAKWFAKIPPELKVGAEGVPRDGFGAAVMTAKKCLPLLDGMSVGYVLSNVADFTVVTGPAGSPHLDILNPPWGSAASTHDPIQLGGATSPTGKRPAVKFHNPWVVRTRPGWSTLFIPVLNHIEPRFTCLAASVDTDTYPKQVNFPAIFHADNYDGVIAAGTPLVVAIPYRRSSITRDAVVRSMTEEERQQIGLMERCQANRSHYYTGELRKYGTKEETTGCPYHQQTTTEGTTDVQEADQK